MAATIYTEKDCDLNIVKGKKLAVIGFGSQGHAHALNLKESGCDVTIGLYEGSKSRAVAEELGFKVQNTADAINSCEVVMLALPDTVIPEVFEKDILPNLKDGQTLIFCHGFAVHFDFIQVPDNVNVIMVAPKGPGHTVRSQYVAGKGVPTLIAVHNDADGNAQKIALSWANGIGGARAGVFETNFREETVTDLFGEQTVLCGGASALVKAGFEVLVEAGYQPEMAYFECLHELKLIVDLMNESGIAGMRFSISETAEYGDVSVGPAIIDASVKERMAAQLKRIESGEWANEWMEEYKGGCVNFNKTREDDAKHQIEQVGERLRGTMSWINKSKATGGTQASFSSSSN